MKWRLLLPHGGGGWWRPQHMTWLLGQEGLTLTFQENVWWWWRAEASWLVGGGGGIFDPQNNFVLHFLFKKKCYFMLPFKN